MRGIKYIPNIGDKFHRLTIIDNTLPSYRRNTMVIAVCDCGKVKKYALHQLLRNKGTTSCGCFMKENNKILNTTHGLGRHPLYQVWKNMINRCYTVSSKSYRDYGARGVTVCDEWINSVEKFFAWAIDNGWRKGLKLDKDKLAPNYSGIVYSPEFCCFLTLKENAQYRRNVILIKYKEESKSLTKWAETLGFNFKTAYSRIYKSKWPVEKAFEYK